MQKKKILITGVRTAFNKGTMSIVVSGIEELSKLIGNTEFIICSPATNIDSAQYHNMLSPKCNIKVIGVPYYPWLPYPLRALLLLIRSIPSYFSADIVIDMRGEGFCTTQVAIFQSAQLLLGVFLRKPVVVYAQSLGPFRSKVNQILAKITLSKMSLITMRETRSMAYFQGLGVGKKAYLCADQAFLLKPADTSRVDEILAQENICDRDKPLIGISPFLDDKCINLMVKAAEYLIDNLGATMICIPHSTDIANIRFGNDRLAAEKIYQQINRRSKVKLITKEYTPKELKGIIGRCDMYITCRFHAGIAATSMHVPTILVLSYHKVSALDILGQEKFVISPSEADFPELRTKIDLCWLNKDKIREELKKSMEEVRKSAMVSAELTAQLLKKDK